VHNIGSCHRIGVDRVLDTVYLLSSGVIPVSAIVFGDAPGYCPLTTTVGRTTSGNSLIGKTGMATEPAATMRIASPLNGKPNYGMGIRLSQLSQMALIGL
jgi:hypothetical protein